VTLLSATGWHLSEVGRFARGGELTRDAHGLAVVSVKHKLGDVVHSTLANEEQAQAAQRIRTKGLVAPYNFSRRFAKAAEAAGVGHITAGVFRHSVATWAIAAGMPLADVAKRLNHKDPRTTRDFYADMRVALPAFPEVHLSRPALPAGLLPLPPQAPAPGGPSE
jgi:integrase